MPRLYFFIGTISLNFVSGMQIDCNLYYDHCEEAEADMTIFQKWIETIHLTNPYNLADGSK